MIHIPPHIIKGCRSQERKAQKYLFEHTSNYLYGVIIRYARDESYTQDILQEAFIKILGKIDTYDESKAAITTWMHSIAVRCAINHLRKKHNYFLDIEDSVSSTKSTSNTGLETLEAEHILRLIKELPDIQRTIFNMNVLEGYSHKEISEQLDIPEATSRSYLSRAKTALKNKIESMPYKMIRS